MNIRTLRRSVPLRALDVAAAVLAVALVVTLSLSGLGPLPALGSTFNPGTGVWRLSSDAVAVTSGEHTLPGLAGPATVAFEANGLPHITAATDDDLWRVIGYTQARFRLMQMDLMRRQGSGALAEILGPASLESDTFEIDLGVRRAAERDWREIADGPARAAMLAFSAGVNTVIDDLTARDQLPIVFKLLGYTPTHWSPVDTMVIQRLMTQNASFSDSALTFSYPAGALDPATFRAFFPEVSAIPQHPFDPGPYTRAPLTPLPVRADAVGADVPGLGAAGTEPRPAAAGPPGPADLGPLLERMDRLPARDIYAFGGSNAWAVSGARSASGQPLFATDPHLELSIPAVWFHLEGTSPGYHFVGATVPGIPVPLLGRTDTFSWGITIAAHPTVLFYLEQTEAERPDEYYWRDAWHPMETIDYEIAVKGEAPLRHQVKLTSHGPVMQVQGRTVAVWWAGTLPSPQTGSMMSALQARDFEGFRRSLGGWAAPAVNFVYADRAGNIGAFGTGASPQVPGYDINLPLPGDGRADVAGSIPYEQLPHTYNPPSGYVVSANDREVTAEYPYQFSAVYNFPDPGWRSGQIAGTLASATKLTAADFERLQTDEHDPFAQGLLPQLNQVLAGDQLTPTESAAAATLSTWDGDMAADSAAAIVMSNLMEHIVYVVFKPWYDKFKVPIDPRGRSNLQEFDGPAIPNVTLQSTLLNWIQHDPTNPYLSVPDGQARDSATVLRQTFHETVSHLITAYGADPGNWRYGDHHSVLFESLLLSPPLSSGPHSRGGSSRSINAAVSAWHFDGKRFPEITKGGPSYRFVMDWGSGDGAFVYPGGQSESPLSPWYENGVAPWLDGELWPMYFGAEQTAQNTSTSWRLVQ
jgi:penicillin amidase